MKKNFATVSFLFLFCVISAFPAMAQTVTPSSPDDTRLLNEILKELKQLRLTLAKTNVNQLRFQTVFEQYKSQQSRVDSMNRELEFTKNQMVTTNPMRENFEEMIKSSEERLLQTTDQRQRQGLERQIQSMRRNIETQELRDKRTKERQTTLEMQIPVEQAKLEQINLELDRIKQDINTLLNQ